MDGQQRPPAGMASLAGRELPSDLVQQVSNVTMGQLFYILSHIQKLSAQAPVTAQRILAENPQICHALLHAECLAGMLDEPGLPLSAEELQRAKAKARQLQDEMSQHELPPPPPPPSEEPPDQKAQLMQKLMQLTPDEISRLPQVTKVQLLNFLKQNKSFEGLDDFWEFVVQPGCLQAQLKPTLRTGQRVVLHGLEKSPELNGHRGVVVRWREDTGRYAVRVAGKEIGLKPDNLKPAEGGAMAAELAKKLSRKVGEGTMYNPEVYARVPGAGPRMTHWVGQVKAGRRVMVRAEEVAEAEPLPLWFGDRGFVNAAPVDVALLITDVGEDPGRWQLALARALSAFPAAAGRLRQVKKDGRQTWQIFLNNAGVPFTMASVPPCGLPAAEVLQLACQDDQCGFFDMGEADGEEDPLLRVKLIHEEGTARGLLGISFNHVLCDIFGLADFLRRLHAELEGAQPPAVPSHSRHAAQAAFDEAAINDSSEAHGFEEWWPSWPRAQERWSFTARRLRSGLRGRPDGVATLAFAVPQELSPHKGAKLGTLKAQVEGFAQLWHLLVAIWRLRSEGSSLEILVGLLAQTTRRLGRGRRVLASALVTKDYRAALEEAAPGQGLDRLFANVVTHSLSFEVPEDPDDPDWLQQVGRSMRRASDAASLRYVRWQSEQDHFRGLPNMFGSLCCNTWGRALSELSFIEAYAVGMRSIDERAERMCFPLDAAYMQVLPQPSGTHRILLTMPVSDMEILLKDLPEEVFDLPHVSEMRTHTFRVPLPGSVIDRLNPAVETHHIVARVACVGDSLTACGYPKFLQAHFDRAGMNVQVRNFGVTGATAQKFADQPYWEERKLEDVRVWRPHFVVTLFGTNDAKSGNWDPEAFEKDYQDLCLQFLERLEPRPETVLLTPPPAYSDGDMDVQQEVVNQMLPEAVRRVAVASERAVNEPLEKQAKRGRTIVPPELVAFTSVVEAFETLGGSKLTRRSYFAEDGIHPNEKGTKLLALTVFAELRSKVSKYLRKRADQAARPVNDNPLGL
ncbi:axeA1 [Symbiodinium pilosum]|uniref:AxeA1 protein n=1 Tax=Symbiodinium pilosum TaxID=2952 RepID=A0A812NLA9_SYMPI|nr:axeA1 [Symbiodinium pilosum]